MTKKPLTPEEFVQRAVRAQKAVNHILATSEPTRAYVDQDPDYHEERKRKRKVPEARKR